MPAVSTRIIFSLFHSNSISIESIVVPGISVAIRRWLPITELMKVDFPALGLPITAILNKSFVLEAASETPSKLFNIYSLIKSIP